jgi:inorganic triphosphatase YgiF
MGGPRETELKLCVDRAAVPELLRHPLLVTSSKAIRLRSRYYDTPKHRLEKSGISLRVRSDGETNIQTIKTATGGRSGMLDRGEWEERIEGSRPDLDSARATPLRDLASKPGFGSKLRALIETDVARTTSHITRRGSLIEMVVDEGEIRAGTHAAPVCEVELELKDGSVDALFDVARELNDNIPLRLGVESKSERGYALLSKAASSPTRKYEAIDLDAEMGVAQAFKAIIHGCLRHYRLNETLFLSDRSPAALHQCRIALRRLRTALSFFKALSHNATAEDLRQRFAHASRIFGRARNLDVFLSGPIAAEQAKKAPARGTADLVSRVEKERDEAYDELIAMLDSAAFRQLMIDLVAWVETGVWQGLAAAQRALTRHACKKLDKWRRAVRRGGRNLASLTPQERHDLRIAAKRLRYACEFMVPIYQDEAAKRCRRFMRRCDALQVALGDLNDVAVWQELAFDLASSQPLPAAVDKSGQIGFAAGVIAASRAAPEADLVAVAQKTLASFSRARPFWQG